MRAENLPSQPTRAIGGRLKAANGTSPYHEQCDTEGDRVRTRRPEWASGRALKCEGRDQESGRPSSPARNFDDLAAVPGTTVRRKHGELPRHRAKPSRSSRPR